MKVDTSFLQVPLAAAPHKPQPHTTEQASARPVDRPHHDEPANNRQARDAGSRAETHRETSQSKPATDTFGRDNDVDGDEKPGRNKHAEHEHRAGNGSPSQHGGFSANPTQPASVGELLDVIA